MSYHTFSFLGCKYESPSCLIIDVAVDTALLAASVGGSYINPYTNDPDDIDF